MANIPHHGGTVVILGGGPSPMGVGGGPSGLGSKTTIPLPKGFDLGDTKPGGSIDVTAHCKLSADGKSLVVQSIDDTDPDDDDDDDTGQSQTADDSDDDSSSSADDWQGMMNRKNQGA